MFVFKVLLEAELLSFVVVVVVVSCCFVVELFFSSECQDCICFDFSMNRLKPGRNQNLHLRRQKCVLCMCIFIWRS